LAGQDAVTRLEEQALRERVSTAIRELPECERTVVTLFYINEYCQKEIAAFLELSVTPVNCRLHAARQQLKEELIDMAREDLQQQRPSENERFVDKAVKNLHDEFARFVSCTLTDVRGAEPVAPGCE
jgi:sigma-70-like protein